MPGEGGEGKAPEASGEEPAGSEKDLDSDVGVRTQVRETILYDETDGRGRYDWSSRYAFKAKVQIWLETAFVSLVLVGSLVGLYLTWCGILSKWLACPGCSIETLRRYAYFFFAGMLGSVLFGGKYLYHVVARGYWHEDRRLWRILSPFLSASLALMVAAAIDSGMLGISFRAGSHAACVALGFFAGYFADKALAKMSEIADVIFGVRDSARDPRKHEQPPQKAP
jgi:hypothetical protein